MRGSIFIILISIGLINWHCAGSRSGLDTTPERFQCYYDARIRQMGNPIVYADFIQFFSDGQPRLDVYVEVPHSNLYFATTDEQSLDTEYTVNISFNDPGGKIIESREYTRRVSTTRDLIARYAASDKTLQSFNMPPGEYRVIITVQDGAVGNRTEIREVIQVYAMNPDRLNMSSLLLIRSIRQENDRRVITPMLSDRVLFLTEPFTLFTEVYNNESDSRDIRLRYGIVRTYYNNDFIIDNPFSYRVQRPFHRTGISIDKRDTVTVHDTTLTARPGSNQLFLTFDNIVPRGSYEVFVAEVATVPEAYTPLSASTEFTIHSLDYPHMTDVDLQIDALNYVATTRELNHLRAGETVEDRRKRLHEYWQNVGAWKMSDYYERARAANELFTANVEGWKTPMGMVYMILGEPQILDCRIGVERTEIWTYYLQSGGLEFTFVRERTADAGDQKVYYWVANIRGGYTAWLSAVNMWR
jgi:GWxTD domain-containing protein